MPAPSIVVTLEDARREEWEVRLFLTSEERMKFNYSDRLRLAVMESDRLADLKPKWAPTKPLILRRVELWNQLDA